MTTLPYSELNTQQRAQAAWLFADACFGTNPEAYQYEIEHGHITGRTHIAMPTSGNPRRTIAITVVTIRQEEINRDLYNSTTMHRDALAAMVAHRLYQKSIQQEITPCNK